MSGTGNSQLYQNVEIRPIITVQRQTKADSWNSAMRVQRGSKRVTHLIIQFLIQYRLVQFNIPWLKNCNTFLYILLHRNICSVFVCLQFYSTSALPLGDIPAYWTLEPRVDIPLREENVRVCRNRRNSLRRWKCDVRQTMQV